MPVAMKHEYRIEPERRRMESRYRGDFDLKSFLRGLEKISRDPAFDPDYDTLVDLKECNLQIDVSDVETIAEIFDGIYASGKGRTAVLLDDPRSTALAMLFQKRAFSREIRLFNKRENALNWLEGKD